MRWQQAQRGVMQGMDWQFRGEFRGDHYVYYRPTVNIIPMCLQGDRIMYPLVNYRYNSDGEDGGISALDVAT